MPPDRLCYVTESSAKQDVFIPDEGTKPHDDGCTCRARQQDHPAHNVIDLSPAESVVETLLTSAVPFPPGSARVRHHRVTWRDERLTVSDSTSTPSASQSLATADLVDEYGDRLRVCDTQFRQFGGRRRFSGRVRTVSCYEDNGLVRELLRTPGDGCVLVVDGGGSVHTALTGDLIAASAVENGWAGLVINGAVRDSAASPTLGIKALGTNPGRAQGGAWCRRGRGVRWGHLRAGDCLCAGDDGVVLLPAGRDRPTIVDQGRGGDELDPPPVASAPARALLQQVVCSAVRYHSAWLSSSAWLGVEGAPAWRRGCVAPGKRREIASARPVRRPGKGRDVLVRAVVRPPRTPGAWHLGRRPDRAAVDRSKSGPAIAVRRGPAGPATVPCDRRSAGRRCPCPPRPRPRPRPS